ncbi:hypothetical protein N0V83_001539 [Neocucurbitaria cava]|uniref:RING-type domain-containing protein n=1 Tax=Neocucurbitaria cava TaxID=798079 RepID=A0A9W8YF28_9PLEO|nr:hypothetical protein N0V83_001539 [Neocucurbitaria cava]
MPTLRSQAEFFMTGVFPWVAQPNVDCTICTEPLNDDVVQMVACGHCFHCVCVLTWFRSSGTDSYLLNRTCPNCRHVLYEPTRAAPVLYEPTRATPILDEPTRAAILEEVGAFSEAGYSFSARDLILRPFDLDVVRNALFATLGADEHWNNLHTLVMGISALKMKIELDTMVPNSPSSIDLTTMSLAELKEWGFRVGLRSGEWDLYDRVINDLHRVQENLGSRVDVAEMTATTIHDLEDRIREQRGMQPGSRID